VLNNADCPRPTFSTTAPDEPPPGPVKLQNYDGDAVQFRNIWIEPLDPAPQGANIAFIEPGALWRYEDSGSDLQSKFRFNTYDDSGWQSGWAQLGYGGNGETTVIRKTYANGAQIITDYFRKSFIASNVWAITNLTLRVIRDDGIVVYLNETEVMRENMPVGTINYNTTASGSIGGGDEMTWFGTNVSAALLREGTNWVAVELHQVATTSDASFDLMLSGVGYPQPNLDLARTATNLTVAWPALPGGFQLESSADFSSNAWQQVTNSLLLQTNKQAKVALPSLPQNQFFRLRR
jgi:hypothetical protein